MLNLKIYKIAEFSTGIPAFDNIVFFMNSDFSRTDLGWNNFWGLVYDSIINGEEQQTSKVTQILNYPYL